MTQASAVDNDMHISPGLSVDEASNAKSRLQYLPCLPADTLLLTKHLSLDV